MELALKTITHYNFKISFGEYSCNNVWQENAQGKSEFNQQRIFSKITTLEFYREAQFFIFKV